ncbi:MAG TPA: DUF72 domain-containing protein [Terriglobales bacterium]|nr:DUF72 domain-containing protein [Terriglobales bacterium]
MAIYAGTSGWAYAGWKPDFYPPKLPSKSFLSHYSTRLNTVEVNYSFRRLVSSTTFENWAAATPAEFRFAVKAHQKITHILRLKNAEEMVRAFMSSVGPLHQAGKLGPILFQLPPNLKCSLELLDEFLLQLPRTPRYTVEFRHESWFADRVYDLLRKHNVALCVAESEDRTVPDETTADFSYYRFRQPEYSAEQRRELAQKLSAKIAEGKDVFAYFKHEETPQGALYAEQLLQAVKAKAA